MSYKVWNLWQNWRCPSSPPIEAIVAGGVLSLHEMVFGSKAEEKIGRAFLHLPDRKIGVVFSPKVEIPAPLSEAFKKAVLIFVPKKSKIEKVTVDGVYLLNPSLLDTMTARLVSSILFELTMQTISSEEIEDILHASFLSLVSHEIRHERQTFENCPLKTFADLPQEAQVRAQITLEHQKPLFPINHLPAKEKEIVLKKEIDALVCELLVFSTLLDKNLSFEERFQKVVDILKS